MVFLMAYRVRFIILNVCINSYRRTDHPLRRTLRTTAAYVGTQANCQNRLILSYIYHIHFQ